MTLWQQRVLYLIQDIQFTAALLREAQYRHVRDAGLGRKRWAALMALSESHYALCISDFGRTLRISRQAARSIAIALERSGYVSLEPTPGDRRSLLVSLTPRGTKLIKDVRARFAQSTIEFVTCFDDRQLRTMLTALGAMRGRLALQASQPALYHTPVTSRMASGPRRV
jgi:DNA-binding MarR family transcriptional regulator